MRKRHPFFSMALMFFAAFLFLATASIGGHTATKAYALDNGLAKTPPMGWNDWNAFGCNVNADLVEQTAKAMVDSGMKDAGYQYVNIDDCWLTHSRDANGNLVPDPQKFPQGIQAVADYVHSLGLKLGIYEDSGTYTCAGYPGSYGNYAQDAKTFASWGVDYVKFDWCNVPSGNTPQDLYAQMRDAILATGRPIVFSICNWGVDQPWNWGPTTGNLWRTTGDISDNWGRMLDIFHQNVNLSASAGPGHWNDPDMLEVGNGGMTNTEYISHFSLWAEMAAPLIAGTDLRKMSDATKAIMTNKDVIAIDQDPLGVQGQLVQTDGTHDVLSKPLANGDRAVVLFNEGDTSATISATAQQVGFDHSTPASAYVLQDLWTHQSTESAGTISANVPAHGVVMYRIHPGTPDQAAPSTTLGANLANQWMTAGQTAALTATFTNNGALAVSNVHLGLNAPADWNLTSTSNATFGAVPSGKTVQATWTITAPASSQPIQTAKLAGTASYVWGDNNTPASTAADIGTVYVTSPVQAPYQTFTSTEAHFGQLGSKLAIYGDGADIWGGSDNYSTIYQAGAAGASATAITEVTSQANTSDWAKSGIMMRNDMTKAGSSPGYVILAVTPGNGVALQWDSNGNGYLDSDLHTGTSSYPTWLKLVKSGTTFTGYYSTDGSTWNTVGSATISSAAVTQDVGVFTTSHSTGTMGEADFDHFSVN